jgi:signal transduction histidine kinase
MPKADSKIKSLVLIVDDNPENIKVVGSHLRKKNIEISIATSGEKALLITKSRLPDLILLDIMMPKMDGFEVCKKLKKDSLTNDIPIIFLTAKIETRDIVKAFNCGVVDYITKPFKASELLARVNTHLKLKHYRDQIEENNRQLENLNIEKNELLSLTAHDLKNPIYSISMLAKVIKDDKRLLREEIEEFSNDIIITTERMLEMINQLLDINRIEQGEVKITIEKININDLLQTTIGSYKDRANAKNIEISFEQQAKNPYALTDRNAAAQIFDNLVSNAIKYSYFDSNVHIKQENYKNKCRIEVRDEGPGINNDDMKKLFGKYAKLSAKPTGGEDSTGLGLSIVKKYIELIDGKVWCESQPGKGANFIVELQLPDS